MSLDHLLLNIPLSSLPDLVSFLITSLSHLGFKELARPAPHVVGLGVAWPYFWLVGLPPEQKPPEKLRQHFGFRAESHEQVREFHENALKAGGVDNGAPGPRAMYGPDYYGAFVLDPVCGINFEVVYRAGRGS